MPALVLPARFSPSLRLPLCRLAPAAWRWPSLFALAVSMAASCSKGGANPDDVPCAKLADQSADEQPVPKNLYAELRGTPVGTGASMSPGASFGVMLSGSGGIYSGMYAFGRCDPPDKYYVERLVLTNTAGSLIAVATSTSRTSGTYSVVYPSGSMTTAMGLTSNAVTYARASAPPSLTVLGVTPAATLARQGDRINVQVNLSDEVCGIRESQWWLTSSPGTRVTEPAVIDGGSGTASVRVAPKLTAGNYYVEGQVTLRSGRVLAVRRNSATDPAYKLFEAVSSSGTPIGNVGASAMPIGISDNPDADRAAPVAWRTSALPAGVGRCEVVNLSLLLTDDKGLGPQTVKMFLGPAENSKLASTTLSGTGVLSGVFVVPADAPFGIWYGYPDLVRDAAGNEARGSFNSGKFSLIASADNVATGQPVMAATFIVPNPAPLSAPDLGAGQPRADGGASLPDLGAPPFPATLATLNVTAPMPPTKEGDIMIVQMTWNDLAKVLN